MEYLGNLRSMNNRNIGQPRPIPNEIDENGTYFLITNIPSTLHSKDLRCYFSYLIEKQAFLIFHYRHRPEKVVINHLKNMKEAADMANQSRPSGIFEEEQNLNSDRAVPNDNRAGTHSCESMSFKSSETNISVGIEKLSEVIKLYKYPETEEYKALPNKQFLPSHSQNLSSDVESTSHYSLGIQSAESNFDDCRCCCLVLVKNEFANIFKSLYNKKFWLKKCGFLLPVRCLIFDLTLILNLEDTVQDNQSQDDECSYLTKSQLLAKRKHLCLNNISEMLEFQTPPMLPNGNVGTPNAYLKGLLDQCKLPSSLISKLGLEFGRRPKKKYSHVHLNYGTEIKPGGVHPDFSEAIFTENGDLIPGYFDIKFNKVLKQTKTTSSPILELEREEEEEGTEIEDWERFEAFHDDVTKQERSKERVFEDEIEVVWEKGGSGLVFYTDAQFWRIYEGGEEERDFDEWDVDTSVYYDKQGGDMDAKATVEMNEITALKSGKVNTSVFGFEPTIHEKRAKARRDRRREEISRRMKGLKNLRSRGDDAMKRTGRKKDATKKLGDFEEHTKGIGRRLLESQGWREGDGLGRERKGMPRPLAHGGKHPEDRTGFGYNMKTKSESKGSKIGQISTAFDNPSEIDPRPPVHRSAEPYSLSHRQTFNRPTT